MKHLARVLFVFVTLAFTAFSVVASANDRARGEDFTPEQIVGIADNCDKQCRNVSFEADRAACSNQCLAESGLTPDLVAAIREGRGKGELIDTIEVESVDEQSYSIDGELLVLIGQQTVQDYIDQVNNEPDSPFKRIDSCTNEVSCAIQVSQTCQNAGAVTIQVVFSRGAEKPCTGMCLNPNGSSTGVSAECGKKKKKQQPQPVQPIVPCTDPESCG